MIYLFIGAFLYCVVMAIANLTERGRSVLAQSRSKYGKVVFYGMVPIIITTTWPFVFWLTYADAQKKKEEDGNLN